MIFYRGKFSGTVVSIQDYMIDGVGYADVWASSKNGMYEEWPIMSDHFNAECGYFKVVCPD